MNLDDYISERCIKDKEFKKEFNAGYEEFKIDTMNKDLLLESKRAQEDLLEKLALQKASS